MRLTASAWQVPRGAAPPGIAVFLVTALFLALVSALGPLTQQPNASAQIAAKPTSISLAVGRARGQAQAAGEAHAGMAHDVAVSASPAADEDAAAVLVVDAAAPRSTSERHVTDVAVQSAAPDSAAARAPPLARQ